MANQTCIEQTGRFYQTWEVRHVQEAVDTISERRDPWLTRELEIWAEGLQKLGWSSMKANDFTRDMRLLINGRRIRGPWQRMD